jgi:hypothetical protein
LKLIARGLVLVPVLAVALASGGGCGSSSSTGGASGSCTISTTVSSAGITLTQKGCDELSGVSAAQTQAFMQQCMTSSGQADAGFSEQVTYSAGACSRDGAVGGCRLTEAAGTLTTWFYTAGQTAAEIQQQCTASNGTFVSP